MRVDRFLIRKCWIKKLHCLSPFGVIVQKTMFKFIQNKFKLPAETLSLSLRKAK